MRWPEAAGACLVTLIIASPAAAHVIPQPAYLTPGTPTTITFAAPNERAHHVFTGLSITVPAGIELASAPAPRGWKLDVRGQTATWSGGIAKLGSGPYEPFRIAASTSLPPGAVTFHAVQHYDDGGLVRWAVAFTILPAVTATPHQHLVPAIITGILGLIVIGLLLFRMRERQHPDLREE
jgi:uncharacterized protein YcnI